MQDNAPWSPFGAVAQILPKAGLSTMPTPQAYLLQGDLTVATWIAEIGVQPPGRVGAVARGAFGRLICQGPDRWLYLPDGAGPAPGSGPGVVDVTETRCWLALACHGAEAALAGLTDRDMRNSAFPVGDAFGVRLGPLHVLIERQAEAAFLIGGPVASGDYLAAMVLNAIGGQPEAI